MPLSRTLLRALLATTVVSTAFLTGGASAPADAKPGGWSPRPGAKARVFYVDPVLGSDANTGTSTTVPWRTLTKASDATLRPGDSVRLRAGTTHLGGLVVRADGTRSRPIRVSPYGSGARPVVRDAGCVTLEGDHVVVSGLKASGCARAGFTVLGAHDTVTRVEATGSVSGVWIKTGSRYATVSHSLIYDNDEMAPGTPGPDDDYGAFGVEVNGDFARVTGNTITGHQAPSPDYGEDGAAVELFHAVGAVVDHNRSVDNLAFTELGGSRTSGARYAYNEVTSSATNGAFLMTRGAGQVWGPVRDTVAEHNTVRLTGARSYGFGCYGGCTSQILSLRRNIISAGWYAGWADGSFSSSENVYGGEIWFPLSPTDSTADPQFLSPQTGDLRLAATSPAVDRVGAPAGWRTDLAGGAVPRDGNGDGVVRADLGAHERAAH